jgi:hypothetical protein
MEMKTSNLVYDHFLRRQAKRLNVELQKSHGKKWSYKNQLGYRIIDAAGNVLLGENYELTIDEAATFLNEYEKKLKSS